MDILVMGLLAGLFTWAMGALGASVVFLIKGYNQKVLDSMLGFAAGVMIAASFFSLIIPALEQSGESPIVFVGFFIGALFLMLLDKVIPHMHTFSKETEGPKTEIKKSYLLLLAMTIHNIPEGLAVGVAFGSYYVTQDPALLVAAIGLTIGIGIQNFPEGAAVSIPLYRDGLSKKRSFMIGQLSGAVEPIFVIIGIILITQVQGVLPFFLAFAAGAMMYVVIEELIPESQKSNNTDLASIMTVAGLVIMMMLDVMLG